MSEKLEKTGIYESISDRKFKLLDAGMDINYGVSAKEANELGYIARAMICATLPHRDIKESYYERVNGKFKLSVISSPDIGIPFGPMPRLIMIYLTRQCLKTKSREIILGNTLTEFMDELQIVPSGGRWGSVPQLRKQLTKLFNCRISFGYQSEGAEAKKHVDIASEYELFWDTKVLNQRSLWNSSVVLGERIYNEILKSPVPIDMRAIKALKSSSLALDIYQYFTWRMFNLKGEPLIPWELIQNQFGSNYAPGAKGRYAFKKKFSEQLQRVKVIYPDLNIEPEKNGLRLKPSPTHISSK